MGAGGPVLYELVTCFWKAMINTRRRGAGQAPGGVEVEADGVAARADPLIVVMKAVWR